MFSARPDVWIEAQSDALITILHEGQSSSIHKDEVASFTSSILAEHEQRVPSSVCLVDDTSHILGNCMRNISRWIADPMISRRYFGIELAAPYLTELAHFWTSIDKAIAICVAELEDKELQELFIKCCFHFNRLNSYWEKIVKKLTGYSMEELEPLPSTLALQLALQELGRKDVLAFANILDAFGTPGNRNATALFSSLVKTILADDEVQNIVEEWVQDTIENKTSYSSVDVIKEQGYPETGSYGRKVAEKVSLVLYREVEQSAARLRAFDDSMRVFHMGIGLYFSERQIEFPRRRIDWLQQV